MAREKTGVSGFVEDLAQSLPVRASENRNADNFRLGYGGGYYDRTLAATPRPRTLGIAYACMQAEFASAPHDVALDLVLTELSRP